MKKIISIVVLLGFILVPSCEKITRKVETAQNLADSELLAVQKSIQEIGLIETKRKFSDIKFVRTENEKEFWVEFSISAEFYDPEIDRPNANQVLNLTPPQVDPEQGQDMLNRGYKVRNIRLAVFVYGDNPDELYLDPIASSNSVQ